MLIHATVRVEPKYRERDGGIIRCYIDPVISMLVPQTTRLLRLLGSEVIMEELLPSEVIVNHPLALSGAWLRRSKEDEVVTLKNASADGSKS